MIDQVFGGLLAHPLTSGMLFLMFCALGAWWLTQGRLVHFAVGLLRTVVTVFTAPVQYLRAAVVDIEDMHSAAEGPQQNPQYLTQRLLVILQAAIVTFTFGVLAVAAATGWYGMVPDGDLRQAYRDARESLTEMRVATDSLGLSVEGLNAFWVNQGEALFVARRDSLQGAITSSRTVMTARDSFLEESDVGTTALEVFRQEVGTPPSPRASAASVRAYQDRAGAWLVQVRTEIGQGPDLELVDALQAWLTAWRSATVAEADLLQLDMTGFRNELQPEYEATLASLVRTEAGLTRLEERVIELRAATRWQPGVFILYVVSGLLLSVAAIWILGLILEAIWLGTDLAQNLRSVRKGMDR